MITLIKYAWYLVTIAGVICFIPYNLSQFSVSQHLKIWPFVLTFFEVITLMILGFYVPTWMASLRLILAMNEKYKMEQNNDRN